MSYNRSAALATITVNGRTINFVSTHLASESAAYREVQVRQLMSWARGFAEQRIIAGDFNAGLSNIPYMAAEYNDGWTAAAAAGAAQDYPGNYRVGSTFTNGYRIDFVFESDTAQAVSIRSAETIDTRSANGVMPSDHKPLVVTYNVQ
jgi:endonuclease/exonuclease/phosphatase family metal-dependent hydrolase